MNLNFTYYKELFTSLKRGKYKGNYINAKPILVLSIIDAFSMQILYSNKINISNALIKLYELNYLRYQKDSVITPFYIPFWHLKNEPFWHINLEEDHIKFPFKKTPSLRWQKQFIKYVFLNEGLYNVLINPLEREELRKITQSYYFPNVNEIKL